MLIAAVHITCAMHQDSDEFIFQPDRSSV